MASASVAPRDAAALWRQKNVPVIYRPGGSASLKVHLPYLPDNAVWLRGDNRRKLEWMPQYKCWEVPKSWFDDVVRKCLLRFGRVYVIQPFRTQEKCAPACWNARGFECECSCMGKNHGSQHPGGSWRVISDTFAVQHGERQLACRLITSAGAATHGHV
jgi:hypothetical protein